MYKCTQECHFTGIKILRSSSHKKWKVQTKTLRRSENNVHVFVDGRCTRCFVIADENVYCLKCAPLSRANKRGTITPPRSRGNVSWMWVDGSCSSFKDVESATVDGMNLVDRACGYFVDELLHQAFCVYRLAGNYFDDILRQTSTCTPVENEEYVPSDEVSALADSIFDNIAVIRLVGTSSYLKKHALKRLDEFCSIEFPHMSCTCVGG